MTEQLAGFPYWQLGFGEDGQPTQAPTIAALAGELQAAQVTDLFMFSHGWNNSEAVARGLYTRFFGEMNALVSPPGGQPLIRPGVTIGVAGVLWPSLLWADEPAPGAGAPAAGGGGGAAAMPLAAAGDQAAVPSDAALVRSLEAVYSTPAQRAALEQMAGLLDARPANDAALQQFQQLMAVLVPAGDPATRAPEEQGQRALVEADHRLAFERMATAAQLVGVTPAAAADGQAAAGGGGLSFLWDGAKEALRQASYFMMKQRAGTVGQQGLGPFIGQLQQALPALRVHLIGHSFGARLVSFALAGLPAASTGGASPIKALTLLQGAFSHFAFAASLPQAAGRAGALDGMRERVDGPLVASFSSLDTAVGVLYPWASLVSGQDASAADDPLYPWGAMGHDGSQAVNATELPYAPPGTAYPFAAGQFFNLDGNQVIVAGGPPAGAHGDICHPEIVWAVLAAGGLAA